MRPVLLAAALAAVALPALAQTDPHQWLEGVETPQALAWVARENARSTAALQGDPRYADLHDDAFEVLSTNRRLPNLEFAGAALLSFWQDEDHVRGLVRRTTLKRYRSGVPDWRTVLDVDALAKAEQANWVWTAIECRPPAYDRCLVALSDGGKDAVELREIELASGRFVDGGFRLSESKQTAAWLDADTLILNRDWGPGTLTESGYGFVVKTLSRGQLLDEAVEVFRGAPTDVSVWPHVFEDAQGRRIAVIEQSLDFFHSRFHRLTPQGARPLAIPQRASLRGFVDGRLIVQTAEPWGDIPAGSLVAVAPEGGPAEVVFAPSGRVALDRDQVAVTKNRVVAVAYDNVRGRIMSFAREDGRWIRTDLPADDNAAITIASASDVDDRVLYKVEGFLAPWRLMLADAATGKASTLKAVPALFSARGLVVEQLQAASKDGTPIPYFLVRPRDAPPDGGLPVLLHGYGGFQLSELPEYDAVLGRLWLEKGGAYALANIRGGGEFGPAWHEGALKENRQRAYDDLFAVSEDLIARGVTSPSRLGVYGRSNGGLLAGVAMTQRPELYNAVVIESPLLDMLRYHALSAGASWIGEYGDPRVPEEAAWIARYSPYQALKPDVAYPLAYITTNTRDDRVHPGHARKFAARLAELGVSHLYYEDVEGGHANAADPKANARRWAMHYVYLMQRLMDPR